MNDMDGRSARRSPAALTRCLVAALWLAAHAGSAFPAESIGGLGAAFRPQGDTGSNAGPGGSGANAVQPGGLRVVVLNGSTAHASIDGRVVHVGDTINGMRVTRITEQGVVLTGEGGVEERLSIHPPSVVKRLQTTQPARVSKGAAQ